MFADALGELQNRDLLRVADVCRQMLIRHHQPVDPLDQVGNVTEAARLLSIPINRQRLADERLINKVWQRAAVIQPHPRPIGIEDSHDMRIHLVIAVIRHSHRFGKALRFVVDAARANGIDVSPVVFVLRRNFRITVTFARGGQKKLGVLR